MIMDKINVAELLKDCPKSMELDCTAFNNVKFQCADNDGIWIEYIDSDNNNRVIYLTCEGGIKIKNIETKCVIYPKGKTTWEGFVPPCQFQDGDIVCTAMDSIAILGDRIGEHSVGFRSYCGLFNYEFDTDVVVSPERFATEKEKAELFDAIKANGYKWNTETKTLEKLVEPKFKVGDTITNGKTSITIGYIDNEYYYEISRNIANRLFIKFQDEWNLISEKFPNRFNINTLIPFESKVLVRAESGNLWKPAIFGCYMKDKYAPFYVLGGTSWKQCIPYEGNQHLLGKTTYCDEYFKTWK